MNHKRPSSQRGAVLMTTVILLLLITVLALSAVLMNSTQTRVAANSADSLIAYQTAEGALTEAENALLAGNYDVTQFAANTAGLYVLDAAASTPVWSKPATWTTATAKISSYQGGSNAAAAYVIEKLPSVIRPGQNMKTPTQVYRITARAVGQSGNSPIILQSTLQIQ
jgi:type IV pilus assembly protein PilX